MARSRNNRDPVAPKRNLSAYLLYQNAMRDTFKGDHPEFSFGELSKYTSHMYSQLTTEEKTVWQERAEADKERYLSELTKYVPNPGYDNQGNHIAHFPHASGSKKKQRDPMAPKRNLSAYLLYQNAMRDSFKTDNPGMTFGQLSKYTSHMYKSLTPEEKAQWEERAQSDKIRFDDEMNQYVPPHGFDAQGNLLAEFAVPRKNSKKNTKDPNMPKRARGSFLLFTKDERPKIQSENPKIKFTDLGAVLGERWRNLPDEDRKKYDALAEQDKLRFAHEMEIYKQSVMDNEKYYLQLQEHQDQLQQQQQEQQQAQQQQHQAQQQQQQQLQHQAQQQQHQAQQLHAQDIFYAQDKQEYKQLIASPHNGYDIYHQDDLNHQQYLHDQQHQQHQVVYQQHPATILHPDHFYHQQIVSGPMPGIGPDLLGRDQVVVYEHIPVTQLHYEDVDIYRADHDIHHSAYYAP